MFSYLSPTMPRQKWSTELFYEWPTFADTWYPSIHPVSDPRPNFMYVSFSLLLSLSKIVYFLLFTLAGPYVNIYLTHDGKRYAKWKSSVHYDTAVELFNETFQFNISKMDTSLVKLCIHIKEFHRYRYFMAYWISCAFSNSFYKTPNSSSLQLCIIMMPCSCISL